MYDVTVMNTPNEGPGAITNAVDALQNSLDQLDKAHSTLNERLSPLLNDRATTETQPSPGMTEVSGVSPLAVELDRLVSKLNSAVERVISMTHRIDL